MKKPLFTILLLFSFSFLICAQQPTARPDIDELLTLKRSQKSFEMFRGILAHNRAYQMAKEGTTPLVNKLVGGFPQTPNSGREISIELKTLEEKISTLVQVEMSWEKMKPEYERIYAKVYTPDEIKELIAFYKTPVGQMLLDKEPLAAQQTSGVTGGAMRDLEPKIQEFAKQARDSTAKAIKAN